MSRSIYSPAQKEAVLARLTTNGGDIGLTSRQTGVPRRTLYTWRQELWERQLQQFRHSQHPSPPVPPSLTLLSSLSSDHTVVPLSPETGQGEQVSAAAPALPPHPTAPPAASDKPAVPLSPEFGGEGRGEGVSPPSEADNVLLLQRIRHRLIGELAALTAEGLQVSSPYQRILALTMLLDRLMKLDAHLEPYTPINKIRTVEYVYPDGSRHKVPPWQKADD